MNKAEKRQRERAEKYAQELFNPSSKGSHLTDQEQKRITNYLNQLRAFAAPSNKPCA